MPHSYLIQEYILRTYYFTQYLLHKINLAIFFNAINVFGTILFCFTEYGTVGSAKRAKPTHFFWKSKKKVSISGQNGYFDHKFKDNKDVADKTEYPILSVWPTTTVVHFFAKTSTIRISLAISNRIYTGPRA